GKLVSHIWLKRSRPNRTAITVGLTRRRRRPLRAKSKEASAFSVREKTCRNRRSGHAPLIVDRAAGVCGIAGRLDMRAAGAALALGEPAVSDRRFRRRYFRERNV